MRDKNSVDIDAMIEQALSSETLRPAPLTLHRRVTERVRIASLLEQERSRFRYSMAILTAAFLGVFVLAGLLVSYTTLSELISYGISGGRGQIDAYATSMLLSWAGYSGAYSLLLSIMGASIAVVLGLISLRKYLWSN